MTIVPPVHGPRGPAAPAIDARRARRALARFAADCGAGTESARLTPKADPSPYATCFGVFCLHLCGVTPPAPDRDRLAVALRKAPRAMRQRHRERPADKGYRQLLAFTLSALAALNVLDNDPLADLVEEQIPSDVVAELRNLGCLAGVPGSGNQAMFLAVFLLHARDVLGLPVQSKIDAWVEEHLRHMNRFGFWGADRGMTHLQFQNGYHQYEILEYLRVRNPREAIAIEAVRNLVDRDGHFAPYPGGGGCYDYDAAVVLTPGGRMPDADTADVLRKTAATLLAEQHPSGGFAESLAVRPRSLGVLKQFASHVLAADSAAARAERARYSLALMRPKHDRIQTHWSRYSRRWDEPDLWDSWFRLLTVARIQTALEPGVIGEWGFIGYPGIGSHPGVRGLLRAG